MTKILNPIQAARESVGRSRQELALIGNCSYLSVYATETGRTVSPSPAVLEALKTLGFDPDQLTRDYAAWRKAQGMACLSEAVASGQ